MYHDFVAGTTEDRKQLYRDNRREGLMTVEEQHQEALVMGRIMAAGYAVGTSMQVYAAKDAQEWSLAYSQNIAYRIDGSVEYYHAGKVVRISLAELAKRDAARKRKYDKGAELKRLRLVEEKVEEARLEKLGAAKVAELIARGWLDVECDSIVYRKHDSGELCSWCDVEGTNGAGKTISLRLRGAEWRGTVTTVEEVVVPA